MAKKLTDEEVESEISELLCDPDVQLARVEHYLSNKRRQYMYKLHWLQKRGQKLREAGITRETLSQLAYQTDRVIQEINKIV